MPRLSFGAFLAPHHPVGEHPMLQFRRDLDLVEQLDRLGYDEFWCGEHHSSGWEMIGSPEMFLAAAGERSKRIKLATGVVSLPYHHPFNVAQRMVQLDWMTGGRAIFGSGPGALASDAHTLGIDPMVQRDRQDEAIGIIRRLMRGERVTAKSDWFTLQDAALQLLPLQEEMPFAVASQISPSGMTLAGKHGIGVISIGSLSRRASTPCRRNGALPRPPRKKHGKTVDRKDWRVLLSWHIAETREKAIAEAREGLLRHHNQYIVGTLQRPGAKPFKDPDEAIEKTAFSDAAAATIGTPDDLVARHQVGARDQRRLRHRGRLCPRLGQPGKHGRAAGTWWRATSCRRSTAISPGCGESQRLRRDQPRRLRPRQGSDHGQDQRERGRGRGARGDQRLATGRRGLGQQRPRSGQGPARPGRRAGSRGVIAIGRGAP